MTGGRSSLSLRGVYSAAIGTTVRVASMREDGHTFQERRVPCTRNHHPISLFFRNLRSLDGNTPSRSSTSSKLIPTWWKKQKSAARSTCPLDSGIWRTGNSRNLCPRQKSMASRTLAEAQKAKGLLERFWRRESDVRRAVPPGFPSTFSISQTLSSSTSESSESASSSSSSAPAIPNPFLPLKNPTTGKWRPPRYSRRRQAELVKAARLVGVDSHLPLGPRGQRQLGGTPLEPVQMGSLEAKVAKSPVQWVGEPPAVNEKGLYGSRRLLFKGHKWERVAPEREQKQYDFKVDHDKKRYVCCICQPGCETDEALIFLQSSTGSQHPEIRAQGRARKTTAWSLAIDRSFGNCTLSLFDTISINERKRPGPQLLQSISPELSGKSSFASSSSSSSTSSSNKI